MPETFWHLIVTTIKSGNENEFLVAAILAIASFIFFEFLEGFVSDAAKAKLGFALKTVDLRRLVSESPDTFLTIADKVFGSRLFSLRAFIASSIISVALVSAIILLLFIHYQLDPRIYLQGLFFVHPDDALSLKYTGLRLYHFIWSNSAVIALIAVSNIFIDFLSLTATRTIIQTIREKRSVLLVFIFLFLDLAVSYAIFLIPTSILANIWMQKSILAPMHWEQFPFLVQIPHSVSSAPIGTLDLTVDWYNLCIASSMLTSLLTSAWLWVFVAASVLAWLGRKLIPAVEYAKWAINFERKPFRSMAPFAAAASFALFYLVLYTSRISATLFDMSAVSPGVKSYTLHALYPVLAAIDTRSAVITFTIHILAGLCGTMVFLSSVWWALSNSRENAHFAVIIRAIALFFISSMLLVLGWLTEPVLGEIAFREDWRISTNTVKEYQYELLSAMHIMNVLFPAFFVGSVAASAAMRTAKSGTSLRSTGAALITALAIFDTLLFWNHLVPQETYLFSILCDIVGGLVGSWIIVHCTSLLGIAKFIPSAVSATSKNRVEPPKHPKGKGRR